MVNQRDIKNDRKSTGRAKPNRWSGSVMWIGLALLMIWVGACGDDKVKTRKPKKNLPAVPTQPTGTDAAGDSTSTGETYVYSPVGKRDPFRSEYKIVRKKEKEAPGGILTKFEIDQLKLTVIISGIPNPKAQVELPDGKGVTVRIGSRIGKNKGRVVRIKSTELVIAEDYTDWAMKKKRTNYIRMKLHEDKKK